MTPETIYVVRECAENSYDLCGGTYWTIKENAEAMCDRFNNSPNNDKGKPYRVLSYTLTALVDMPAQPENDRG